MPTYLDIFAGAGGLSEGFMRAGYTPLAHIEMDRAACYTLKTRLAYRWLVASGQDAIYTDYLTQNITREDFYKTVPKNTLDTVLNYEISKANLAEVFLRLIHYLEVTTLI